MWTPAAYRDLVSGRQRGPQAALGRAGLLALEVPYRCAMWGRNRWYDWNTKAVQRVARPVISVGNLTMGGTGKTPFVAWLAKYLRDRDIRVSLVSRGFGATEHGRNDEAQELELLLPDVPHVQDPNRVVAANIAIEELDTQLILLDDGFQHRRIHRDLDIVLLDATEHDGFGHVFPRGTMRESPRELRRAHAIVLTRSNQCDDKQRALIRDWAQRYAPLASWTEFVHLPVWLMSASGKKVSYEWLQGRRIAAFCGIGNPENFRRTLAAAASELVAWREYPDHHSYTRDDVSALARWASDVGPIDAVICTWKDLVKIGIESLGSVPLHALQIAMQPSSDFRSLEAQITQVLTDVSLD